MSKYKQKLPVGRTGGGKYDPQKKHLYFIASNPSTFKFSEGKTYNYNRLIAVNELQDVYAEFFDGMVNEPGLVFLDSGVFSLASRHAKRHGITHDEALKTPIDSLDGFQDLFDRYIRLVTTYEDRLWGYVEIDAGGTEQKRITRAKLEGMGLRPIPVYHPLNDGWDYFDELASKYDRICVGNIVQASRYVRLRIMATIHARKQAYPNLWIHLLGMTPNEWANAYPMESMDSSSWLAAVRWPQGWRERSALRPVSGFSEKYVYILGDSVTWNQSMKCVAVQAGMNERNMQNHQTVLNGLDLCKSNFPATGTDQESSRLSSSRDSITGSTLRRM